MALIPWRPKDVWWERRNDLETIREEMNRLFNHSFSHWTDRGDGGLLEGVWSPAVDIYDGKDAVLVRADIPGMRKDGIDVTVHGDTLVIKGEKQSERGEQEKSCVREERFSGSFNRTITLPAEIDAGKVTALYSNGVLELTLPKKEEYRPKQIRIDVQ